MAPKVRVFCEPPSQQLTPSQAVATVLSNWNNVLQAITMASSMFEFLDLELLLMEIQ
jgi:hypothetical protein